MNELEKCGAILVDIGYAQFYGTTKNPKTEEVAGVFVGWKDADLDDLLEYIEYTEDSLQGRQQADAIENWLHRNSQAMLIRCKDEIQNAPLSEYDGRIKRLERIRWCIRHLIES